MTDTPMTPDVALTRLCQYGERTSTWSTATYSDGTEKALHQIAVTLATEVGELRAQVAELTDAPVDEAVELAEGAAELEAMRREHPAPCRVPDAPDCTCPSAPRDLRPGADTARRMIRARRNAEKTP